MIDRFIQAQSECYTQVIEELKEGKKQTHWMWYIFPQIIGLGYSETSKYYAIHSKMELYEYCNNNILSQHYEECLNILLQLDCNDPIEIFGDIDALKLKSSLTLFSFIPKFKTLCEQVLEKYFNGHLDAETLKLYNLVRR